MLLVLEELRPTCFNDYEGIEELRNERGLHWIEELEARLYETVGAVPVYNLYKDWVSFRLRECEGKQEEQEPQKEGKYMEPKTMPPTDYEKFQKDSDYHRRCLYGEGIVLDATEDLCQWMHDHNISYQDVAKKLDKNVEWVKARLAGDITVLQLGEIAYAIGAEVNIRVN